MSLLTDVMERPLDPGYAAAAARRRTGAGSGAGRRPGGAAVPTVATAVLAALLGVVLVTAAVQAGSGPDADRGRQDLLARVVERTAAVDDLAASTARLRAGNEALQERLAGAAATEDARRADALAPSVGAVAVSGPGVRIVLSDAAADPLTPPAPGAAGVPEGRVLDRDLQVVVDGLWAAGAEAVAVNGRRLTSLTAIRSAGRAVVVGYRPLVPPYEVVAVGDPTALQTRLAASTAGSYLRALEDNYGIGVEVSAEEELLLPAADSVDLRVARPALPSPAGDDAGEERS